MEQEQIIDNLLKEYVEHRQAIKDMIVDLEKIRVKIDTLLPDTVDKRFKFYFEEKVKALTGLFNSLLDMRKEIAKSVKDEIEIRRRMVKGESLEDLEELLDVRKIARTVKKFQDTKDIVEEKIEKQEVADDGLVEEGSQLVEHVADKEDK